MNANSANSDTGGSTNSNTSEPALHRMPDRSLAEFAELVGAADSVAVEGNRTRWNLGGSLHQSTRLVRAPSGIVSYSPEEMTVRVRAGTSVGELAAALTLRGQRCALPDRGGTVGGAIAVGENHLEMLGRGTLRASVLEVRYVSADGVVIVGGGPTVKNVTGFDLPRLLTGSLGTLGLIGEVIVRTNPTPSVSQWMSSSAADPFVVRDTLVRCGAVLWDGVSTWALVEGHRDEVDEQARRLGKLARFDVVERAPTLLEHRWSLPPATLRELARAGNGIETGRFVASVGTGLVFAERPQPARILDAAVKTVSARIKQEFDPSGRLNPGRNPAHR